MSTGVPTKYRRRLASAYRPIPDIDQYVVAFRAGDLRFYSPSPHWLHGSASDDQQNGALHPWGWTIRRWSDEYPGQDIVEIVAQVESSSSSLGSDNATLVVPVGMWADLDRELTYVGVWLVPTGEPVAFPDWLRESGLSTPTIEADYARLRDALAKGDQDAVREASAKIWHALEGKLATPPSTGGQRLEAPPLHDRLDSAEASYVTPGLAILDATHGATANMS